MSKQGSKCPRLFKANAVSVWSMKLPTKEPQGRITILITQWNYSTYFVQRRTSFNSNIEFLIEIRTYEIVYQYRYSELGDQVIPLQAIRWFLYYSLLRFYLLHLPIVTHNQDYYPVAFSVRSHALEAFLHMCFVISEAGVEQQSLRLPSKTKEDSCYLEAEGGKVLCLQSKVQSCHVQEICQSTEHMMIDIFVILP